MKPKLKEVREEAVYQRTAFSVRIFFQYFPLDSDIVFLSSKESRTKTSPFLKKKKTINVFVLFEEQIMISFLRGPLLLAAGSLLPEVRCL